MKIQKKHMYAGLIIAVLLTAVLAAYYVNKNKKNESTKNQALPDFSSDRVLWLVDKDGYLVYPQNRGDIKFRRDNYSKTEN